jgi:hypothetical protein
MATRTSSQTGNWSSSSTWGGNTPPGDGDTAIVNHNITVDTNVTVGIAVCPDARTGTIPTGTATTGGSLSAATYILTYSYLNAAGVESYHVSDNYVQVVVSGGNNAINFTPPSLPSGVTGYNIYYNNGPFWYRLNDYQNRTGTTLITSVANITVYKTTPASIFIANGITLTVASGITLTNKGHLSLDGAILRMEAGSTLEVNPVTSGQIGYITLGDYFDRTTTRFRTVGTSGSHVTVRATTGTAAAFNGGPTGGGRGGTNFDCAFADFIRIGNSTVDFIPLYTNGAGVTQNFTDCTFTDCGRINSVNSFGAADGILIERCRFISGENTTGDLRLIGSAPSGGVTRSINLSSFENPLVWTEESFNITNSVLDGEGGGAGATGRWLSGAFSGNFVRMLTLSGGGIVGFAIRGHTDNCYFLPDNGTNNPHGVLPRNTGFQEILENSIYEYTRGFTDDTGDWFYGDGNWIVRNCIVLPSAAGANNFTSSGAVNMPSPTGRLIHCTLHAPNGYGGGVLICDGNAANDTWVEIKSNIFWGDVAHEATTNAVSAVGGALTVDNVVTPSGCTYNCRFNVNTTTPYQGDYPTTQPGANDLVINGTDPEDFFTDPSRNIATWAVSRGSVSGTYLGQVADARSYLRADPSLIADLLDHVRSGFAPIDAQVRDAGHDGVTMGAVEMGTVPGGGTGGLSGLSGLSGLTIAG